VSQVIKAVIKDEKLYVYGGLGMKVLFETTVNYSCLLILMYYMWMVAYSVAVVEHPLH